jgi:hypothetical protein
MQTTIQEYIDYGESRFRQILLKISSASKMDRKWMVGNLEYELVLSIISFPMAQI